MISFAGLVFLPFATLWGIHINAVGVFIATSYLLPEIIFLALVSFEKKRVGYNTRDRGSFLFAPVRIYHLVALGSIVVLVTLQTAVTFGRIDNVDGLFFCLVLFGRVLTARLLGRDLGSFVKESMPTHGPTP
jgi:hypothetical protein